MEDVNCIFCDIASGQAVIEENGYFGRRCPQCRLIYLSPRPSRDEVHNLYAHDLAHIPAAAHVAAARQARRAARHHLRLLKHHVEGGSLLEIGAGAGYFLDEARKVGFEPFAAELNPAQARHIRETLRIPCEEAPLASLFAGRQFDAVYHCDVISHFHDPVAEFREMHARLRDGGVLIFETGNIPDMHRRYFDYFERFQFPDHLYFFGASHLKMLLDRTGFELLAMHRYSILPQLRLLRAAVRARNAVRRGPRPPRAATPAGDARRPPPPPGRGGLVKTVAQELLADLGYVLRYPVGRMARKGDRPQTMVVVARKRTR